MRRSAVVVLLSLASASLAGCFDAPTRSSPLPIESVAMPSRTHTPFVEPLRTVVRSSESWEAIWERAFPDPASRPPLPFVNFDDEMVVFVALGEQRSGGHQIDVSEAVSEGTGLRVSVTHRRPGARCAVTAAMTQPIDVVRVPRRSGTVRFDERRRDGGCN